MKRINAWIEALGLNKKKEIMIMSIGFLAILGITVGLYFLRQRWIILPVGCGVALLFGVAFFFRYPLLISKKQEKDEEEFTHLFTFFGLYVQNGCNVYQALSEVAKFATPSLQKGFSALLSGIDADKSLKPYLRFASHFPNLEVKQVLVSIYQMVDQGASSEFLRQYEALFSNLARERHKRTKEARVSSLKNLSFLPLAGSGITMLCLAAALIEIMGGLYSVI